jgi:hypothetical protein
MLQVSQYLTSNYLTEPQQQNSLVLSQKQISRPVKQNGRPRKTHTTVAIHFLTKVPRKLKTEDKPHSLSLYKTQFKMDQRCSCEI